ncbi:hypothetical protein LJC26_06795 [Desulfovibrio sp. OttesenSCG-928-O18]|nr:hypothetical protein [Desulfovibrio sp. OttesenSCG-928-O18]
MRNLFRPPSETLARELEAAISAIRSATPLARTHEKELPFAVRDLSRLLTQDRSDLRQSYWINKRLQSAYCRYFLPWNLVRLAWLLPGLELEMQAGDTILDLGSGPLTLPIALWLAKPAWRTLPLTVVCGDVAPGPMAIGRDIFRALAGDSPWKIELKRGPMDVVLRGFSGKAKLVTAANVLNELRPSRETPLEARLFALIQSVSARLAPNGRFLAVEPGTRLGGKLMAQTRRSAFAAHLVPEAPCPHWGACPMLEASATGWCHFSHSAQSAPKSLADLTAKAKLGKQSLSLSCVLLRPASGDEIARAAAFLPQDMDDDFPDDDFADDDAPIQDDAPVSAVTAWAEAFAAAAAKTARDNPFLRVLSDPIRLPDTPDPARYGCSARGLALVLNALRLPSGAAFAARWPQKDTRDPKTGALIVAGPEQLEPRQAEPRQSGPKQFDPNQSEPKRVAPKRPDAKPAGADQNKPARARPEKSGPPRGKRPSGSAPKRRTP